MRTAGLAGLLFLAAACSGGEPTMRTPVGPGTVTQATAVRLLTTSDITSVGGDTDGLDVSITDRRADAEATNPVQVERIESWYAVAFQQGSAGPALFFSIQDFESTADAQSYMDLVESGQGYASIQPPIGDRATRAMPIDAGIGSSLIFSSGDRVALIHTTRGEGNALLADAAQVAELARMVADRLAKRD